MSKAIFSKPSLSLIQLQIKSLYSPYLDIGNRLQMVSSTQKNFHFFAWSIQPLILNLFARIPLLCITFLLFSTVFALLEFPFAVMFCFRSIFFNFLIYVWHLCLPSFFFFLIEIRLFNLFASSLEENTVGQMHLKSEACQ